MATDGFGKVSKVCQNGCSRKVVKLVTVIVWDYLLPLNSDNMGVSHWKDEVEGS